MKKVILISIIILAFILRFYRLDSYPSINADEASIGYDAYSLLQTGKDQHGNAWPVNFQSFNDYKPGLYVYMVMPFVKVIGLNEWAIRLPNALIGVLSVYLIYLLVLELFKAHERDLYDSGQALALMAAFFLAISPWHIHFSRGGWEANVATFFIMVGILFWAKSFDSLRSLRMTRSYLFFSVLAFVLSMYCYQATRVVTPLLGLGLVLIYRREIFKNFSHIITVFLFGIILLIPLVIDFTHGAALSRAAGVGLFADPGPRSRVEEQRGEHGDIDNFLVKVFHNKLINYSLAFAENWMSHFHGEFLFLSGDSVTRNKVPETGEMYLIDIIFISAGAVMILRNTKQKHIQIVVMWVIVGPVASALTFQAPSALRAENMVIPLIIISSLGLIGIVKFVNSYKVKKFVYLFIGLLVLWQFARYLQMYYVHMAKEYPYSSQYGVKELVSYVEANQNKYSKILVTDRYDQPYVLFLYYMQYPPAKFQSEHILEGKDHFGFSTVGHFDKYYFSSIKFNEAKMDNTQTLIVGTQDEIPKESNIVKDIYGENGFLYFRAVAN